MLTYNLIKTPGMPLYESLYRCLRRDILDGTLPHGTRLPSKRALAQNLQVSKITVEAAYSQLLSEGFIRSQEKRGYYVEFDTPTVPIRPEIPAAPVPENAGILDLTANGPAHFPFSVWSRLQREVMLDYGQQLLKPLHNQGCIELRRAIAQHLSDFRGMDARPENIVIGAGTDFLYNLVIQLLGRDMIYAVEDPGYDKIHRIYTAAGVRTLDARMDAFGVIPESLGPARVLHISPAHHFPSGTVTAPQRRLALLSWAEKGDCYIIEDDYDCEFRFHGHSTPAVQTLDPGGRVIYMNSFSKSLAPSIRIGYMVLPDGLAEKFRREFGFYSCTVASFEQYTLARFLSRGHFEKQINRLRKFYRSRRDRVMAALEGCPMAKAMTVLEADAGLHFLLRIDSPLSDRELADAWEKQGIRVKALSSFYRGPVPESAEHCLVINYSGLDEDQLWRLETLSF